MSGAGREVAKKLPASIPRIALTPSEAAAAIGVGPDFFDANVAPELRIVRRGRKRAWAAAGIPDHLRLHQARHTYASFMIRRVSMPRLSVFMGHSSIKVTFDLYGHVMPGTESEAAALLDSYLDARVEPMSKEALAGAVP